MIRVLQVIDNMDIGGMESMLMNYYRHIDHKNVQFDFLLSNKGRCRFENEIKKMGGRVYKVTPRRKNFLKNKKELSAFFNSHKYKIVEIHQGVTYLLPLRLAKKHKTKTIIIHNHGIDKKYKNGLYNCFRKKFLIPYIEKSANVFFACSDSVLSDLFSKTIISQNKYHIIRNAIDVDAFAYNEEKRRKVREELRVVNKNVVGHIGNFTYPKNQSFIIEIARKLPDYVFVLVDDGKLFETCKKGSPKNTIFCGSLDDVKDIMQAFDVFILPSLWEGLPLVAVEAQAAGLPVLLSNSVSNETKMTSNVSFLPLEVDSWAEAIRGVRNSSRKIDVSNIKQNGYDVNVEAKKLELIYLNYAS